MYQNTLDEAVGVHELSICEMGSVELVLQGRFLFRQPPGAIYNRCVGCTGGTGRQPTKPWYCTLTGQRG